MREVINLTRLRGAGSLGHEWGHALDHLIGQSYGSTDLATKGIHGKEVPESLENVMNKICRNEKGIYTEFYTNSVKFDGQYTKHGQGYWASDCELFARAFACYLSDKLEEKGDRNDYLNGTCDTFVSMDKNGKWIFAYPKGKERLRINKAFDELINELKEIGILSPRKEKKEDVPAAYTAAPDGQLCFA